MDSVSSLFFRALHTLQAAHFAVNLPAWCHQRPFDYRAHRLVGPGLRFGFLSHYWRWHLDEWQPRPSSTSCSTASWRSGNPVRSRRSVGRRLGSVCRLGFGPGSAGRCPPILWVHGHGLLTSRWVRSSGSPNEMGGHRIVNRCGAPEPILQILQRGLLTTQWADFFGSPNNLEKPPDS